MLQEDVVKSEIVTAIKTDHLAITLEIDSLGDQQRVLPFFIHYDQNTFLKGRTTFDAVRTISDV